jgi:Protein of unknown function (DUF4231)
MDNSAIVAHRSSDPITERLEDQIAWYDRNSLKNQRRYKRMKFVVIVSASVIPFLATLTRTEVRWITGGLGVLITVIEGVLQLNQYQQNWISYRSTCEALKHEKYVYLGKASPYAEATDPHALLAERIESLVSQENAKWLVARQDTKSKN